MFRTILRPAFSLLVAVALHPPVARGDVHVPAIFGDHMVLQQESKVPVWGTAEPGEKVTVTVGDHQTSTTAGADGTWRVDLSPFSNGAPATTMTIQGKNALTFQDVLIGDVWLASGQSNMEAALTYDYNGKDEAAKAKDPQLRLFRVARATSVQPMSDVSSPFKWGRKPPYHESDGDQPGKWVVCNPNDAGDFSAVAYLFGKELRAHLQRPIGLIGSYWGGTVAEAWTSPSGLEKTPPFTTYLDARRKNIESFTAGHADYERTFAAYLSDLKTYEKQVKDTMVEWQAASLAYSKAQKLNEPLPPKPAERPALPEHPKAPARPDGQPVQWHDRASRAVCHQGRHLVSGRIEYAEQGARIPVALPSPHRGLAGEMGRRRFSVSLRANLAFRIRRGWQFRPRARGASQGPLGSEDRDGGDGRHPLRRRRSSA